MGKYIGYMKGFTIFRYQGESAFCLFNITENLIYLIVPVLLICDIFHHRRALVCSCQQEKQKKWNSCKCGILGVCAVFIVWHVFHTRQRLGLLN